MAEPTVTNIITEKSPAVNRMKDLKKDFCGLIVGEVSIIKILDPFGPRIIQVLFFFFEVFQVHLFFFDLRNVEVLQKSFNA